MRLDPAGVARNAWSRRREVLFGIERFPVAIAALAIFVVAVNLEIAGVVAIDVSTLARLGAATSAAAAIATAVILFSESDDRRGAFAHLVSLGVALVFGGAIWFWGAIGAAPPALLTAAALAIPLAPYARRRLGFWSFLWQLAHAAALAFLAVAIFCAGVSAILASLEYLFGIRVESSIYGHVWSTGIGFVGPLFALSQIPLVFPESDEPDPRDFVIAGMRVLSDFVAVPLLAVYAAMLHAYGLKIVLTGELPRGQIGWMVLSFGLAVLALRVLVDPFGPLSRAPTRLFLRWFAPALVVPWVLLAIAVWQRIAAYDLTPERYALALFAVFLALLLVAQLWRPLRGDIRLIPALGALLLLLTGWGPWGMVSLPARQQTANLVEILAGAGAMQDGRIRDDVELPPEEGRRVNSIVRMLDEVDQLDRLRPLFAGRDDDPFVGKESEREQAIIRLLDAEPFREAVAPDGSFWIGPATASAVRLEGYDLMLPFLNWTVGQPATGVNSGGIAFTIETAENGLTIRGAGRSVFVESVRFRTVVSSMSRSELPPEGAPLPLVELDVDGVEVAILFDNLGGMTGDNFSINAGRFLLFLRAADWR